MKKSTKSCLLTLIALLLLLGAGAYFIFSLLAGMSMGRFSLASFLDFVIVGVLVWGAKALINKAKIETGTPESESKPVEADAENVPEAPAPESVVITCEKCGQTMLIPSGSGAVKVTCPKCGSDIIYTYDS